MNPSKLLASIDHRHLRACMSLGIENDGVAERWYAACLRCAAVPLLNLSLRQAGKSGVEVVHAYGPAAKHLRFLPESFYSPSSGRPYRSMESSLMNSPIGGNFGPAIFMCRASEAESGLMCRTLIRVPSSLKYTLYANSCGSFTWTNRAKS